MIPGNFLQIVTLFSHFAAFFAMGAAIIVIVNQWIVLAITLTKDRYVSAGLCLLQILCVVLFSIGLMNLLYS